MDFIAQLKKIDLHCHLDGSLSEQAIRQLAANAGITLPKEEQQLSARLRAKDDCKSLAEYLTRFEIPVACLCSEQNLRLAALDVMRQAAEENVVYMEIRFAPLLSVRPGLDCRSVIESVVQGLAQARERYHVRGNAIICGMRHDTPEDNIAMIKTGREFLGAGVCAADLAGDEAAHPVAEQKAFFEAAQKLEMPYTIHAGECGSAQSVRDAVSLGARRIGHGIAMRGDRETRAMCRHKGIGIEMCPVSNLQTKAVGSWVEYPIRSYLDEGIKATVNTDNRTVSNTNITRELRTLREQLGLTEDEMVLLMRNAAQCAFLNQQDKETLLKEWD